MREEEISDTVLKLERKEDELDKELQSVEKRISGIDERVNLIESLG